ncbi:MAG: glycosyl hydrolase family 8 [Salinivirgaceae bacterium]|jgi:endo-1,4-beta-D-glucanase Y|nr:glycosyl hydrolase family 8 [Salinivirgaceae bacterium]
MKYNKLYKKLLSFGLLVLLITTGFSMQTYAQTVTIQAEDYATFCCGDGKLELENNGNSIGYFDNDGEMLTYSIDVTTAGYYEMSFKYLAGESGNVVVRTAQNSEGMVGFQGQTYPGGWWLMPINEWPSTSDSPLFYLPAGNQNLYIINKGVGFNIDYFSINYSANQSVTIDRIEATPSKLRVKPAHSASIYAKAYSTLDKEVAIPLQWSANVVNGVYSAGAVPGTDIITVSSGNVTTNIPVTIGMPVKTKNFMVNQHGQLSTNDKNIVDKNGNAVSFAGPSWFWSCSASEYWTAGAVDYFVEQWRSGIVRLPMSIAPGRYCDNTSSEPNSTCFNIAPGDLSKNPETGARGETWNLMNYMHNKEYSLNLMKTMIDAAIENDVYVVVDFHEHWAHKSDIKDLAIDFFTEIASMYGDYPNIIYEIFNEPNNNVSNYEVQVFANEIIPVIRAHDQNNVIVVGSSWWSQQPCDINLAQGNTSNVAYTLHYYSGDGGHQNLDDVIKDCNRPIMVTECGNETGSYYDFVNRCKEYNVSNMSWAVNNKVGDLSKRDDHLWSVFNPEAGYDPTTWDDADLSGAGQTQKSIISTWPRSIDRPIPICEDEVLNRIEITAPTTSLEPGESLTLGIKAYSACKEIAAPSPISWTGANGGVFSSDTVGEFTITACYENFCDDIRISVDSVVDNILINGDFSDNLTAWTTYVDNSATANVTVVNGELAASISYGGTADWNVQFYQTELNIENGLSYRVTFDARSSGSRSIKAQVEKNGDPWTTYGGGSIDITNQMANYSYDFTMSEPTDAAARISFNLGASSEDVIIDNVILYVTGAPNQAPIANAGGDETFPAETTSVSLNGSASYDPDNGSQPLTYTWTQTAGSTLAISDASSATPSISGLSNGASYTFQLVVNDGELNSNASTVTIEILEPITNILTNGDFENGIDPWVVYINEAASANPAVQNSELNVNISWGGSEQWHVQAYQADLTIVNGVTYRLSFEARAEANRSMPVLVEKNGDPYTTFGSENFSLTPTMTEYSFDFTMTNPTDNNARLTFNLGTNANDVIIDNVVLEVGGSQKPIANAGADINLPAGSTSTTLDGTASNDPDEAPAPLTYNWTQTFGPSVTISDASSATPTVSGLNDDELYTFQLIVNDGELNSNPSFVNVSVGSNKVYLTTETIGTGNGTITLSPAGGEYAIGDIVTATAIPSAGSDFIEWSGDASGNTITIVITMDSNKHIIAEFNDNTPRVYEYGITPTQATEQEAQTAYNVFIAKFYEDCYDGKARIKWGLASNDWEEPDKTVSEGIAYGMLLTAYFNDQNRFDKLWNYYNAFLDNKGLMHWKTQNCNGIVERNAATDAELDVAFALMVADKNWGAQYGTDARNIIAKIKQYEVDGDVLKPGDDPDFGGRSHTNISYFAPGYFKAFGEYTNDEAFWTSITDRCYTIIDNNLSVNNAVGGLVSDWCDAEGNYSHPEGRNTYSYDACRTPWRIAMDYVWYGDYRAKDYLDKSNSFVSQVGGISQVISGYDQDGSIRDINEAHHNMTFISTFACAGVVLNDNNLMDTYYDEMNSVGNTSYFDYSFNALVRLLLSGKMQNPMVPDDKVRLNLTISGSGNVELSPAGGVYDLGTPVTLTATSGNFLGWSGDLSGEQTPVTITMDGNKNITASFEVGGDPTLIEAETFAMTGSVNGGEGVRTETCYDAGGGQNIGWVDAGDWTSYDGVDLASGNYSVEIRYAGKGGQLQFEKSGGSPQYGSVIDIPSRPDGPNQWQDWETVTVSVNIIEFTQNLGVYFPDGDVNINWYKFTPTTQKAGVLSANNEIAVENLKVYPTPANSQVTIEVTKDTEVVLFDLTGQVVYREQLSMGKQQINISKLKTGVYIVKALNKTKRLIKQ